MCVCVRACTRARVCVYVCVCGEMGTDETVLTRKYRNGEFINLESVNWISWGKNVIKAYKSKTVFNENNNNNK